MILSIIIPVYNTETYLRKCVESLLNQDLSQTEYEIILVDDCSTDSCGQLCDDFSTQCDNIRVIHHQRNKGLSAARNTGIVSAAGKFIQFVDSDDYLVPNVLRSIVTKMEHDNLDILRINYQNVTSTGMVFEPNKYSKPFVYYDEDFFNGITFLNEKLGFACYAVQFVVKASILQQTKNFFKEGIYYEDIEWTPRIILQAQRVASSSLIVYNYLYRQDSITRNVDLDKKRKAITDKLSILDSFIPLRKSIDDGKWFDGMTSRMSLSILTETSRWFYSDRGNIIHELKKRSVFPLSFFHATPSTRYKIILANISPSLFCALLHFRKNNHRAK